MKDKKDKKGQIPAVFEQMEPRLLFSAGPDGALAADQQEAPTDVYQQTVLEQRLERDNTGTRETPAFETRVELVFIDTDTPEYQTLLSDLLKYPDDTSYQVFELDNTHDGIAQISSVLEGYENVNAIHILSHGSEGAIDLGGGTLDNATLADNADLVASWGSAFTDNADILIYGCDLAASSEGQMLVNSLAALTGADVAASDDLTGSKSLGGDWELEYQQGEIETETAFDAETTQEWSGVLLAPVNTVPATQATDEDTSLVLSSGNGNAISVSDADSSSTEVTLTVTNGTVTLTNTIGPEFLANTITTEAQTEPVIAMAADDSYVVAWTSKGQDDLDGKMGVYFQRYAADGTTQGIETLANQTTLEDQYAPAIAMDAAGNFVISWVSKAQDNVDGKNGVYARLFNADGTAATNEFLVNQTTLEDQVAPAVSMDNAGNFAIAWESKAQDNVDGKNGIYARLFNTAGTPTTGEFLVNQTTLEDQRAASIAMDADGDFVVAWQSKNQDGDKEGIYARQFDASGTAQTNEFLVNQITSSEQIAPSVATDDAGNFVIAWQSKGQDFTDGKSGIIARLYDNTATAQGNEFVVNSTVAGDQLLPVAAMNGAGEFVVSWESKKQDDPDGKLGIFAQYFDATGTAQGNEFLVNQTTPLDQNAPSVALNSLGEVIAVWQSKGQDNVDAKEGVYGQRFLAPDDLTFTTGDGVDDGLMTFSGNLDAVNGALDGLVFTPTPDFYGTANIQIVSDDGTDTDTDDFDITVNPVNDAPANSIPGPQVTVESTPLTFSAGNGNALSIVDDAGANPVKVTLNATQGSISLSGITGLSFTTGDGSDDVAMVFTGTLADINTALEGTTFTPLADFAGNAYLRIITDDQGNTGAGGAFTDTDTITITVTPDATNDAPVNSLPGGQATPQDTVLVFSDSNGNPITLSDDADGSPVQLTLTAINGTLTLSPQIDSETLVNTNTVEDQLNSQVATAADGSYIVVWESKNQDGGGLGIFAQRYNPLGEAEGPEFQVNTFTAGDQKEAAVTMNANGAFVVVWQSANQDGAGAGVFGQLFDTGGTRVGGEFEINTTIANNQDKPTVAMDDAGNFVVSWASKGQDNLDLKAGIYAQRYDATGLAQGDEFLVNTETLQDQLAPAIAMDTDGDFVIVWQSKAQDNVDGKFGIYGQRFNAGGIAQGLEFKVNTETLQDQLAPSVAMDDAGNFVVAWQSKAQDDVDGKNGIYAQRYAANGATQGIEFPVNSTTLEDQLAPSVAMQGSGEFIIAWQSKGQDNVDGKNGIYAQRFDAGGVADGVETLVNTTTLEDQLLPSVGLDADGNAIISWTSKAQDNVDGKNGIYLQRLPGADAITYLTGDGIDDASIVLTSTVAQINEALDGMVFTPTVAFNGTAGIQVDVDDLGNTGSGGPLTDSDIVYISVGTGDVTAPFQVNNTGSTLLEGGTVIISNTELRYDDAGQPTSAVTYTVTGAPVNGQLELTTNPGVAITSFTQAQVDASQVVYKHNDSETVADSFDFDVDDGSFNVLSGQSFNLTITPVNDAPVNNIPGEQHTDTNTALVFDAINGNLISLSDDAGNSEVELTLTATNGLISLSGTTGLTFSLGDGSDDLSMTFTGTLTDINTALDGLAFDPDTAFSGTATLQIVTDDQGNTGGGDLVDTDLINIEVGFYNEAPVITAPASQGMMEDMALVFSSGNGNAISIADVDAAGNDIEVRLAVEYGTLTLGGVLGLNFSTGDGTSDPMLVFQGTVAEINTALEGLTFDPVANYAGPAILQITVNDLGNSGPGGALSDAAVMTINITPDATNDPPTLVMPGPQVTPEDTPLDLGSSTGNLILIDDDSAVQIFDDAVATPIEITISATNGTVSLGQTWGSEFAVNTYTLNDQTAPAVASAPNGDYVVVWASNNQDGNGYGIYGQLFSAEGLVLGGEFRINASIVGQQTDPVVAMADDGSFVVAWTGVDDDNMGVFGQRFNADGSTTGGEFRINTETLKNQAAPAIATDADGNFVVAWQSENQDGDKYGIYGQRYDNTGLAVGSEFQISTETAMSQMAPAVAMDADGDFVVVWQSDDQDGDDFGIYGQRYDASGTAQGGEFQISTRTLKDQASPSVAMDDAGNFVVAWQSENQDDLDRKNGVFAQRYAANGALLGTEFIVNTTTLQAQSAPGVSMDGSGEFVIVWQSDDQDGDQEGIYGQRYAADGSTINDEFRINSTSIKAQTAPAVAMSELGTFVAVWSSDAQDGSSTGIFGQRFKTEWNQTFSVGDGTDDVSMTFDATVAEINDLLNGLVFTPEPDYYGPASIDVSLDDGANTVSDSTAITVQPINDAPTITMPGTQNVAEDQALVFSVAGGNAVTLADVDAAASPVLVTLTASSGTLSLAGVAGLTFSSGDGSDDAVMTFTGSLDDINTALDGMNFTPLDGYTGPANIHVHLDDQGNTGDGGALIAGNSVYISVDPDAINDAPVNNVPGPQLTAKNDPLEFSAANGNAVWITDDSGTNAIELTLTVTNGTVTLSDNIGTELQVNTTTTKVQMASQVAAGPNGEYVVVWQSEDQDGDGNGIFAQRFNAVGQAEGPEFRVNTTTANHQTVPVVAMDAGGSFVVAWQSQNQDGNGEGIILQRFDAEGAALGNELLVNTMAVDNQTSPAIAMADDGRFVVVWQSKNQDGNGEGVYGQLYAADGSVLGDEFMVNTLTNDHQTAPAVAMNASGDFVVAWQSRNQDGGGEGIYGQRFDATGTAVDGEFRINDTTPNDQTAPAVALRDDGSFVVVWQSANQDGDGSGIYAQAYDSAGLLVASEFLVNTTTAKDQLAAQVSVDDDGDYVVVWQSDAQDGNGWGVFGQVFDAAGATIGSEFLVNTTTNNDQTAPAVAAYGAGNFITTWTSRNQDGDNEGVYAQRFLDPQGFNYLSGDGTDDTLIVLRGTVEAINAALDRMVFTPVHDFKGAASIRLQVDDLGHTGHGDPQTDDDTIDIIVDKGPTVDLDADDSSGATGSAFQTSFTWTGASAPVLVTDSDGFFSDPDDSKLQSLTVTLTNRPDGAFETLTADTSGTSLLLTAYNPSTGELIITGDELIAEYEQVLHTIAYDNVDADPDESQRIITFVANDGGLDSNVATTYLTVFGPNDAPVATVPGAQVTLEDTALVFSAANTNAITIDDEDAAGSDVQVTLSTADGTLTLGSLERLASVTGNGSGGVVLTGTVNVINAALDGLQFDPTAYFNGATSVGILVEDLGNTGDGGALSDSESIAVTVTPVNNAPTVAGVTTSASEDAAGYNLNLLANSSDPDSTDVLSVETVALVSGDATGITDNGNGTFSIDPSAYNALALGESAIINYTYDVVESDDGGTELSRTATTAQITISGQNDGATVAGVTTSASEDAAGYNLNLLANSSDPDSTDVLSVETVALVSGDATGITDNGNGTFSIDPSAYNALALGESAIINYTYDVVESDDGGTELSRTATTAQITISGQNDGATVAGVTTSASEDAAGYNLNLLANSSDPDSTDVLSVETVALVSGDATGITDNGNGTFSIDPSAYNALALGESAIINYTYDVVESDDGGTELSRTATTAQITISGQNDGATVAGVTTSASEDAAGYNLNLLANSSDPDSTDVLSVETVALVSGDATGITDNGNGTFSIDPSAYNALALGESAIINYTYDVVESDDGGTELSRTATTAQITISGQNDGATVAGVTTSASEDAAGYNLNLLANSSDPDSTDVLSVETVALVSGDATGITDNGNGTFSIDPSAYNALALGESAIINYTYDVVESDDGGTELSRTATTAQITISGQNDGATVAGVTTSASEDAAGYNLNLLANSSDPDSTDVLSVETVALVSGDATGITDNGNGTFSIDPSAYNALALGESAIINYTYDVVESDDGGTELSRTATTAQITISGQNDGATVAGVTTSASEDAAGYNLNLLANSSDPDSTDVLSVETVALVSGDATGITDNGNGTFSIDPSAYNALALGESAIINYTYDVVESDDGGTELSRTATTAQITISGQNDGATVAGVTTSASEDAAGYNLNLLANSSDPDSTDVLSVETVALVSGDATGITDNGNGTFSIDPSAYNALALGESAIINYTYDVVESDDGGTELSRTATTAQITISGQNDGATVAGVTTSASEDAAGYNLNLLANSSDPDSTDVLSVETVALVSGDATGITDNGNGTFSIDPSAYNALALGESAIINYTYDVVESDDGGTELSRTATTAQITISGQNDGATVAGVTTSASEDAAGYNLNLLANSSDPDSTDVLSVETVALVSGDATGITDNGNGTFSIDPSAYNALALGESAIINYTYDVVESDDGGTELSRTATTAQITISGQNDGATVAGVTTSASEDAAGYNLNLLANSSDPDSTDVLSVETVALVSGDATGITDNGNGTFSIDPSAYNALALGESAIINYTYDVVESDDGGTELSRTATTAQITISGQNDGATVAGVTTSASEDAAGYNLNLLANSSDPDSTDVLSVETVALVSGDATGITDNGNGTFSIDPSAYNALALGESAIINYTYDVVESDDGGTELSRTATTAQITISGQNDGATVAGVTTSASEDAAGYNLNLLANSSDPDSTDVLSVETVALVSGDATGITDNGNGTFSIDPSAYNALALGESAIINYTYDVVESDDGGTELSRTATTAQITISGQNDGATVAGVTTSASEDAAGYNLNLLANSSDPDSTDVLSVETVALVSGDATGITDNGNGTFSIDPSAYNALALGESAIINYTYDVVESDDGGTELSRTATTAQITISGQNDGATVAGVTTSASEDAAGYNLNLLANSSDPDSTDVLSVETVALVSGDATGITDNGNGTFSIDPSAYNALALGESAIINYTYDVVESDDGGTELSRTATTAQITISGQNDAPTVVATASDTGTEDTDKVYTHAQMLALIGAADVDDADANLSIAISNVVNGTLVMTGGSGEAGTTFTFTPASNFVGNLTFDYEISDDASPIPATSAMGTASIALSAVNDAPMVSNLAINAIEDASTVTGSFAVTDPDTADTHTFIITSSPSEGSVVNNGNGTFTFDPGTDFQDLALGATRDVYFDYTAIDNSGAGNAASGPATVTVTITGTNDAPVAVTNEYANNDATVITGNVLTDNTGAGTDSDIDSAALTAVLVSDVSNGVLLLNPDGSFTYTPDSGFSGTDTFTYSANDGNANSAPVTVTLALTDNTTPPLTIIPGSDPVPQIDPGPDYESDPVNETADITAADIEEGSDVSVKHADIKLDTYDADATGLPGIHVTTDAASSSDDTYTIYSGLRQNIETARNDLSASLELWQMIDIMKQQINSGHDGDDGYMQFFAKSATGMALSLSAGVITWALRGGALLASMLSSVPLWKGFDPLPIIKASRKTREDDEAADINFDPENDENAAKLLDTSNSGASEEHGHD